jgi:hypothetical protein
VGLVLVDLMEEEAHSSCGEGVGLRSTAVLLERGAKAAHKCIEATPCLVQWVGVQRWEEHEWVAIEMTRRRTKEIQLLTCGEKRTIG